MNPLPALIKSGTKEVTSPSAPRPVEYSSAHRLFTKVMMIVMLLSAFGSVFAVTFDRQNYEFYEGFGLSIVLIMAAVYFNALVRLTRSMVSLADDMRDGDVEESLAFTHVIILPNYKEPEELLRATIDRLASHRHARTKYILVLAMEQREVGVELKANKLKELYRGQFEEVLVTVHPADLGEYPGKGSNVGWSVREVKSVLVDDGSQRYALDQLVVTVIDSDALLHQGHFAFIDDKLTHNLDDNGRMPMMYFSLPNLFAQNEKRVPTLVRAADVGFSLGQLYSFTLNSPVGCPLSNYSLPMRLAHEMGYWDVGPEGVGEDFHTWLRAYFYSNGDLISVITPFPALLANIESPENTFYCNVKARYTQAVRHLLGFCDIGLIFREIIARRAVINRYTAFRMVVTALCATFFSLAGFIAMLLPLIMDLNRAEWLRFASFTIIPPLGLYNINAYRNFHNRWTPPEHHISIPAMLYMLVLTPIVYTLYMAIPGIVAVFTVLLRRDIPVLPRADKSPTTANKKPATDEQGLQRVSARRLRAVSNKRGGTRAGEHKFWPRWASHLTSWKSLAE